MARLFIAGPQTAVSPTVCRKPLHSTQLREVEVQLMYNIVMEVHHIISIINRMGKFAGKHSH